jgi:hypothetical protein
VTPAVLALARDTIDVLTAAVGVPAAVFAVALLAWIDLARDRGTSPSREVLVWLGVALVTMVAAIGLRFTGLLGS